MVDFIKEHHDTDYHDDRTYCCLLPVTGGLSEETCSCWMTLSGRQLRAATSL